MISNQNTNMFQDRLLLIALFLMLLVPASAQQFLRTDGQDIVNEDGEAVYLRGVGLGNWMLPEGYMWRFGKDGDRPRRIEKLISDMIGEQEAAAFWQSFRANYITEADIERIAELGFNSVRPALNSRLFVTEGENNEFIDEGFLLLDQLIAWCKKHQLYVIIDMHGAPGGQTGQNIDDSPNDIPELFTDPKNQDLLVELWVRIARRYKDEPTVAAYDLLNEPLPENTGAADKYKDQLVPLYKRLIQAIREVDQKHMFTIEGYNWSNNWSLFDEPLDDNAFYQFHYYCWNRPDHLNSIEHFLEQRDELNVPVWVGETGEKGNAIYFATSQYFEKNNIGWSFWPWKKMDTQNTPYSILPPEGWDLVRAYSRGEAKPSREEAIRIFAELEENIKLENCVYHPDVVHAMLRRIPLRIEAENYGHDGMDESYFVFDNEFTSENYRTDEPVPVEVIANAEGSRTSEQAIRLKAGEWTSYRVESLQAAAHQLTLKAKALSENAQLELMLNGERLELVLEGNHWVFESLGKQNFVQGDNEIKLQVNLGEVLIDWLDVH
ncbi:cellulase family glycosylhydrolase [Sunxiuqinia dokdonensis]|uniref:Cellulase n=1 Tax=Sunxiuqinia dokdonensis TaxID=1409788 RepID=A0A0L8VCL0_9BACT|nr:cellulase family glycosylhydrolase [Sunxiuqinia dokdonensis]KOH45932.1 cellulase [Sunxiuqinia dokdonensis]